jgi:hypothetical protein
MAVKILFLQSAAMELLVENTLASDMYGRLRSAYGGACMGTSSVNVSETVSRQTRYIVREPQLNAKNK